MQKKLSHFTFFSLSLCCCILLQACLGSKVKKLGSSDSTATSPTKIVESLPIQLVYRDASSDSGTGIRVVGLQGLRNNSSALLSDVCGTDGSDCACYFYTSTSDTSPVASSAISYSSDFNAISCTISGAVSPENYTYVRLYSTDDTTKTTGFLGIKSTTSVQDLLGSTLDKTKVRNIYRYYCNRTFLEGSTVTGNGQQSAIHCTTSLILGLLQSADYHFYYYGNTNDSSDTNVADRPVSVIYYTGNASGVCGLAIPLYDCTVSPVPTTPQFRLYKEKVSPFTAEVNILTGPTTGSKTVGYAALPDNQFNCPPGFIKVRRYRAEPQSIVKDLTLTSSTTQPYPTNFLNVAQSLSDLMWEPTTPSSQAPSTANTFTLKRQGGVTACSSNGSEITCPAPTGGVETATTASYTAENPILCVIPNTATE